MKIKKKIFFSLIFLVLSNFVFSLSLTVQATSSSDGKTITVESDVPGLNTTVNYSIEISSIYGIELYFGKSITAYSSPGVSYTISVTATCQNPPLTLSKTQTLLTKNPQPPSDNSGCTLRLLNGLTFGYSFPDGSSIQDGEILIYWTPLLNDPSAAPPAALYQFRYREAGSSTWSYPSPISVFGTVVNGQRYGFLPLTGLLSGGVEYEIQVAYVCALPANLSDYSTSYFAYTLF